MIPASDPWYLREIVPGALAALGERVRVHFKLPPGSIGIRGDRDHLRGYHRSREFVLLSPACTDRAYSVQAPGNLLGDDRWCCALDISLPRAELLALCKRLDKAVRAGTLEKVVEWYGTVDGVHVTGYDNIANAVASSDATHLFHAHLSILRGQANDDHSDVFAVLTGTAAPPPKPGQSIRWHRPEDIDTFDTEVPEGVDNWPAAYAHWYRSPFKSGTGQWTEHVWRFRMANHPGAGSYERMVPGKTILRVPRLLGY